MRMLTEGDFRSKLYLAPPPCYRPSREQGGGELNTGISADGWKRDPASGSAKVDFVRECESVFILELI